MLSWLLVNVVISLFALVFIALNSTAPHRLRFYAGFAALSAWLVPWPLLPDMLPANVFSIDLWRIERAVEAGGTRLTGVIPIVVEVRSTPLAREFLVLTVLELCFMALTLIGAVLFAWKLVAYRLLLRAVERQGDDGNWLWTRAGLAPVCPVRVQREVAGAFSSGLLKPRIWVHGDLATSPQLATLLRHEVAHIQQHDNWYLLLITLVERLFWWNPLVWYLGRGTRELQELSCDELCQRHNPDYPAQLAQLMIDSARGGQQPRLLALGANIFNSPNPNVRRIQLLQRSYPIMTKHILGAAVTALSAVLAVGFVTAQPDDVLAVAGERVSVFRLERAPGTGDDVLMVTNEEGAGRAFHVNYEADARRGEADQYFKIEENLGEQRISFTFSGAPLPAVLMPLVAFVSHGMPGPGSMDVAILRALDEDAETIYGMAPDEVIEVVKEAGGTASWVEEGQVTTFSAEPLPPAGPPAAGSYAARFVGIPRNDNLVLEYPEAANRIVSATAVDLTLDEAIALIATESGCNIFQDGDTIVVDYCAE